MEPNHQQFWTSIRTPKQVYKELKSEKPGATFWDIFSSYELQKVEPADRSPEWLQNRAEIINQITYKYFPQNELTNSQLDAILMVIQEFCFDKEDQDFSFIEPLSKEWMAKCKNIAQEYILPHQLNDETLGEFLEALESAIVNRNKISISNGMQEDMLKAIQNFPDDEFSEDFKKGMQERLKEVWQMNQDERLDIDMEDEVDEEDNDTAPNYFDYPQIKLAYSTTFFGFNGDGGDIPYEERDRLTVEKMNALANEISTLLEQSPNEDLRLKLPDMQQFTDDDWMVYEDILYKHPFLYELGGVYYLWEKDGKMLFLTQNQEDKELPIEIKLIGLPMVKYQEVREAYEKLLEQIQNGKNTN